MNSFLVDVTSCIVVVGTVKANICISIAKPAFITRLPSCGSAAPQNIPDLVSINQPIAPPSQLVKQARAPVSVAYVLLRLGQKM
jgi:hypothetical protein